MEVSRAMLGLVDYIIFALMLMISAGIGIYFRFSGGRQKTNEEYLMAGKDMSILPVAFSLMASFLSAITYVGVPSDTYQYGAHMIYLLLGYGSGIAISSFLTLPVYFELQAPSAYEYLDRRFGKYARTITSVAFVLQMILYMSVVLYAPALALSAVTNLPIWVSIVSIGLVCTFYCTLGGMKAVLWTDVLQAILMFSGILVVSIKGLSDMGFSVVYERANEGGRLPFPSLEVDPTLRYTLWAILFQGINFSLVSYGGSQVQIQRLLTVKNISRARVALFLSIPMACSFHFFACCAGIVMYAYYANCDPLTAPGTPLTSADQLLPYYMMSTLGQYPGLPGLCICGVFSASLSTVSSALNSLTAVTMQDFIKPFLIKRGYSLDKMVFGAKAITFFYGFLGVILAFVVDSLGNLMQAGLTLYGLIGGPVLGVLILGMTTTRTNQTGAVVGLLAGIALSGWIVFGASAHGPPPEFLPVSIEGCTVPNATTIDEIFNSTIAVAWPLVSNTQSPLSTSTVAIDEVVKGDDYFILYKISYLWFSTIGLVLTLIIGYVVSLLVNLKNGETKDVPYELITPVAKCCWSKKEKIIGEKEIKNGIPLELEMTRKKSLTSNGVPDVTEQIQDGDSHVPQITQNGDLQFKEKFRKLDPDVLQTRF